jgi:uncharacterized membrane protein
VVGQITYTDAQRVVLSSADTPFDLSQPTIQRISVIGARKVGQHAQRGLLIGAIAGAVLGASTVQTNRLAWTAMLSAGWASLGALIGAIDGLSSRERTVIFESAQP